MKLFIYIVILLSFAAILRAQAPEVLYGDAMNSFARGAYSSALQKFEEYIANPDVQVPQLPAAHFYAAECLNEMGDFSGAVFEYEKVAGFYRLSNFREEALYKLGLAYNINKDYTRGKERLLQLITDYPRSELLAQAQYWVAENLLAESIYDEAIAFYQLSANSKKNNPFQSTSIYKIAGIYEILGQYQKAIDTYDSLLTYFRNTPLSVPAQYRIGYSYFKLHLFENAVIEISNPALNELPREKQLEASYILGASFFSSADYIQADSIFSSLLKESLNDETKRQILYSLAWTRFQRKIFPDAQKMFNTLAQGSDSLSRISLYWKGEAQRYQGRQNEALKTFEEYIKKFPASILTRSAQYQIGLIYFEQKQYQKARSFLLNASSTGEGDLRARIFTILGELELTRENIPSAIQYFNSALDLDYIAAIYVNRAQFGIGVAYYKNGDFTKAEKALSKLENTSANFEPEKINFIIGECYFAREKYSDALARYKKVSLTNEEFGASGIYASAYCYYNLHDYDNAAYLFTDFIKKFVYDNRINDARLRLADSYLATKKYSQAVNEYKDLTKAGAKNADYALYQSGLALFKSGKTEDALAQLKRLGEKYPKSLYADNGLYLQGWMKFQGGNLQDAIARYQQLLLVSPRSKLVPQVMYSIGDCYYNAGNYDSAIINYERVVDNFPNSSSVYDAINGIQLAYSAKGDVQAASEVIEKYSRNKGWNYADQLYLKKGELFYNQGNYAEARDSYESFLSMFPNSKLLPQALYWIGKCSQLLGDSERAMENYRIVFYRHTKSEEAESAVIEWGKMLLQLERIEEALALYENALDKLKGSNSIPEILYWKGMAAKKKGDSATAFDAFDELAIYYENNLFADKARLELGIIELDAKRFPNAVKYFQQLASKRTDDIGAASQYYLGVINQMQDKMQDAITQFVRTLNSFANYDEWVTKSYLRLGECYEKLKDTKKAREMFKLVVDKHKNDEYGKEAQTKLRKLR